MIFLVIFGGFLGLILCYLVVIIFFPVLSVRPQTLDISKKGSDAIPDCRKKSRLYHKWLNYPLMAVVT